MNGRTDGRRPHPSTPVAPPSYRLAAAALVAPARYQFLGRLLEVQICVPACRRRLSACFPLVSGGGGCEGGGGGGVQVRVTRPPARRRRCNRIIDRPVTPPKHIMETY